MGLRALAAIGSVLAGAGLVITGVALVYPPAAMVLAGIGLGALGLLGIDLGDKR